MTITLDDLNEPADESLLNGEDESSTQSENATEGESSHDDIQQGEIEEKVEQSENKEAEPTKQAKQPESVPYSRFAEVNARMRELEEQNAALLAAKTTNTAQADQNNQGEQKVGFDDAIADLVAKEQEALLDGDLEAAKQIGVQKAKLIKDENLRIMREEQDQQTQQGKETQAFESAIETLTSAYPQLNAQIEGHDQKAIATVNRLAAQYVSEGSSLAEAITTAGEDVADMRGWSKTQQKVDDPRKQQALKTAIETNNKQPANTADGGVGNRALGSSIDMKNLSQKEYEKLSEKDREALLS